PGAAELAADGVFSGGAAKGREALSGLVEVADSVPRWLESLCYDAETSGGLLISVPEERQAAFLEAWAEETPPALVGEVRPGPARVCLL
ncbi:MAG: selenide, water dikinase SelD, partial [Planctomycetota bacterium]